MNFTTDLDENGTKAATFQSAQILDLLYSVNCVLTDSKKVRAVFHTHYVNLKTDRYGIEDLIEEILTARGAVFPAGIEETSGRARAIEAGMFTFEIIARVRELFKGETKRYPDSTVRDCLSVFMVGRLGKVKLTTLEDTNRTSTRCRYKWYLLETPVSPNPIELP